MLFSFLKASPRRFVTFLPFGIHSPGENLNPPRRIGNGAALAALLCWKHCFGEVFGRCTRLVIVVESALLRPLVACRCTVVVAAEARWHPPFGVGAAHLRLSSECLLSPMSVRLMNTLVANMLDEGAPCFVPAKSKSLGRVCDG